ncbi:MAG: histidine kinase, partial [Pseudomonas sp.]|uniref:Sir2 family NAD-dependent protein deacetylase n=1 Tax=Pseudomonas sp. TaxID=306 RepID=UPI0011FD8C04
GAGISTSSGIPDYRDSEGVRRGRQPMMFQEFLNAPEARRWGLPEVIQNAIAYQARPMQAPGNAIQPRIVAQALTLSAALENHGGATAQARQEVDGPLLDGIDLDALFAALPKVLEDDKAFAELLS